MSEVKNTDHSADVLASIKSQVPTAVDNYLGTKLDDALFKNQESEKSPKEIIRAKKEQGEEKQDLTYSIRSTDKVDLEEFDLKGALFRHMNKIKSAKRNMPTTGPSAGSKPVVGQQEKGDSDSAAYGVSLNLSRMMMTKVLRNQGRLEASASNNIHLSLNYDISMQDEGNDSDYGGH
ncbi:hypothetical protein Tco_0487829 [Tanacetum coccineum]